MPTIISSYSFEIVPFLTLLLYGNISFILPNGNKLFLITTLAPLHFLLAAFAAAASHIWACFTLFLALHAKRKMCF